MRREGFQPESEPVEAATRPACDFRFLISGSRRPQFDMSLTVGQQTRRHTGVRRRQVAAVMYVQPQQVTISR